MLNLDGTNNNTGSEARLAALLEEELGCLFQWSVCILHYLDYPWLHLLLDLYGKSLDTECFSGPIGNMITNEVHLLPVAKFKPISVNVVCNKLI